MVTGTVLNCMPPVSCMVLFSMANPSPEQTKAINPFSYMNIPSVLHLCPDCLGTFASVASMFSLMYESAVFVTNVTICIKGLGGTTKLHILVFSNATSTSATVQYSPGQFAGIF